MYNNWRIQLERSTVATVIYWSVAKWENMKRCHKVSMDLRAGGNPAYKDTVCQECQRFPWKTMALFLHDHLQWFRRTSNCLKPQSLDVLCANTLENIRLSWMIFPDFYLLYVLLLCKVMLLKDDQKINHPIGLLSLVSQAVMVGQSKVIGFLLTTVSMCWRTSFARLSVFAIKFGPWLSLLVALKIIPNSGTPQLISINWVS